MADDEFAMRKAMERAAQAQQLLETPILIEAFKIIEQEYNQLWKNSQPRDDEGRRLIYLSMKALEKLKGHLEMAVANGQLSSAQIARDFRPPKRFGIV